MSAAYTFSGLPDAAAAGALSQGFDAAQAALAAIGAPDALVFVAYMRACGDGTADFKMATPPNTNAAILSMLATAILLTARDRISDDCQCTTCAAIHAAFAPLEALQAQALVSVRRQ